MKAKTEQASVFSEYGELKAIFLHYPGLEFKNIDPNFLTDFLLDDTPFLNVMQEEFQQIIDLLRQKNVEIYFIEKLLHEVLHLKWTERHHFIRKYISVANVETAYIQHLEAWLLKQNSADLTSYLIIGVRKEALKIAVKPNEDLMLLQPIPNLIFQRDSFFVVGDLIAFSAMWSPNRRQEAFLTNFILKNHPLFIDIPKIEFKDNHIERIEGGDVMVLDDKTLMIGNSQRTTMAGIRSFAQQIFAQDSTTFTKVIALKLTSSRAFMHLDTVMTRIGPTQFLVYKEIFEGETFQITEITRSGEKVIPNLNIKLYLEKHLGHHVDLIYCGGDDLMQARWEQWNDGTNMLAINEAEVIAYDRNISAANLASIHNVKVYFIRSSEISKARGGPRCLSMPLRRLKVINK